MKVLHVMPTYVPAVRYGGPVIAAHAVCRALARQGCGVSVFTTNVDGKGESAVPLRTQVEVDGVMVTYFPTSPLRRLYHSPQMWHALQLQCRDFDLLHLHSVFLWPTWAAARIARRIGIPYLLAPKGMLVKELIESKSRIIKSAWITLIERRNLEQAAGIHVTSELEAQKLREFGFPLPPLYEVPYGVGEEGVPPTPPDLPEIAIEVLGRGRPVILFLGRVTPKKGLDRLIPAMKDVPDVDLLVAGNDEEGHAVQMASLARAVGVGHRVTFCGPVYGAAKAELYRRSTVFCLPSRSENFGNVVLEAMLEGCPVVVTADVGAASIVMQVGGGVVSSGDPKGLAASLRRLIADRTLRLSMAISGRKAMLQSYGWDTFATRMVDVYRRVTTRSLPLYDAT